jgi:membrane protein
MRKLRHYLKRGKRGLFWRLLLLSARDFFIDDGPAWAAAIAYYSLLSLFPLLLVAGSIASYFVDPKWALLKATELLGAFLPKGQSQIEDIVRKSLAAGRSEGLLFFLPLFWTGTLVFGAVTKALNVVFGAEKRYGFLKSILVRLMMLLTLGAVFLLALGSSLLMRLLKSMLGILPTDGGFITQALFDAAPAVLVLVAFLLAYRFVPARRPAWRAALIGAVVAMIAFVAAKPLFLDYVLAMSGRNIIYGSLAGIVASVVWAWMVAMIGLFGGQITSHCQSVLFDGEPIEELERRHLAKANTASPRNGAFH